MTSLRAWGQQLRARVLRYDTEFFGLVSATIALYWALWLMFHDYIDESGLPPPAYYALLRNLFPHWMLTVFFFSCGGGYLLGFLADDTAGKRAALLLSAGLWSLLAYSTWFSRGTDVPGAGLFVILSLGCGWAFLRQKENTL